MTYSPLLTASTGLLISLLLFVGCDAGRKGLVLDLKRTGLAYHSFHTDEQIAPQSWGELIDFAQKANLFPESIQRVKDAGYVVTWGIQFHEMKQPLSNLTLAKPAGSGPVLMMDGSVRE